MTTIKFKKPNIEAYKPGKSSIRKIKNIIKLSANESALGVSPRVKKIIPEILNRKANGAQNLGVILNVQIFHIAMRSKAVAAILIAKRGISYDTN